MATFILVHGAWHGGWCYGPTAEALRRSGHSVFTPTLTGLGERSHLCNGGVNLSTHIEDVCNVVQWEGLDDLILCGHSYGGMVITGVADTLPGRIASLVYLDAFVPSDGASAWDYLDPARREAYLAGTAEHSGLCVGAPAAKLFNVDPSKESWVDRNCTPMPLACFLEPLHLVNGDLSSIKRNYVFASDWVSSEALRRTYQDLSTEQDWTVREIQAGHDMMVDRPAELARTLEELI